MNVSIRKRVLIGIGGMTKWDGPGPRGHEGRRTGGASSEFLYASSSGGDPGAGGAQGVGSRKGRFPARYRQRHPEMSWTDYASCDLGLSLMDGVGGMERWRETRGHARCPLRAVLVCLGGFGMAGRERDGGGGWWWRKKDRRRKFLENY